MLELKTNGGDPIRPLPSLAKSRWWTRASVLCLLLASAGCDPFTPDGTVPVELASGNGDTRNPAPIETSLYRYVDPAQIARKTFRVSGESPLRVGFPGTYYSLATNLEGGPQSQIGLKVDARTFDPSIEPASPGRMDVTIEANIHRNTPIPVPRPVSATDPSLYYLSSKVHPILSDDAVHVYEIEDQTIIRDIVGNAGSIYGVNLARRNIVIKPKRDGYRAVSLVVCVRQLPTCEVYSTYKGRAVLIWAKKRDMGSVYLIAERTRALLTKYDLDKGGGT